MANTQAPFGFKQYGGIGITPTYEQVVMSISPSYATAIYNGDPVVQISTGYIQQASSNSVAVAGIFVGCSYLSTAQKRVVWMPYWPGSDATGDVTAYVITDANAQFIVQSGTAAAVTLANIGNNIGFAIGTGNTSTGLSGAYADQSTINTTATLPFRILALANYTPGKTSPLVSVSGNDPTTAFNSIVVGFNNAVGKSLTGI